MKIFKILFISQLLWHLVFSFSAAFGTVLIIQTSDSHTSYNHLPQFLNSIESVSRRFKATYPNGKQILLVNGDFSSHESYWSKEDKKRFIKSNNINPMANKDRGTFAYKVLAELAKKYTVIYTFGNHDAFDWQDSKLFLKQMQILHRAGVHILIANALFYPKYKYIFKSYLDFQTARHKKIRFIGFTLPNVKEKRISTSDFEVSEPSVIKDILPIQDKFLEMSEDIQKDSTITFSVVAFHLGIHKVQRFFKKMGRDQIQKIKLIFTGHDHFISNHQNHAYKTPIIGSGAFFNYSSIVISNDGRILERKFFNHKSQMILSKKVDPNSLEYNLAQRVKNFSNQLEEAKILNLVVKKKNRKNIRDPRNKYGCSRTFRRN